MSGQIRLSLELKLPSCWIYVLKWVDIAAMTVGFVCLKCVYSQTLPTVTHPHSEYTRCDHALPPHMSSVGIERDTHCGHEAMRHSQETDLHFEDNKKNEVCCCSLLLEWLWRPRCWRPAGLQLVPEEGLKEGSCAIGGVPWKRTLGPPTPSLCVSLF